MPRLRAPGKNCLHAIVGVYVCVCFYVSGDGGNKHAGAVHLCVCVCA